MNIYWFLLGTGVGMFKELILYLKIYIFIIYFFLIYLEKNKINNLDLYILFLKILIYIFCFFPLYLK